MGKKLTHDKFIRIVNEKNEHVKNGEIEILEEYGGRFTPVRCICYVHNCTWYPVPSSLYMGCGCPQCGSDKISQRISMSHEEFIHKASKCNQYVKNGDIEIIGQYNGADNPIECICHIHNFVFYPTPSNLYRGQGCKKCGSDKTATARRTPHDEFIKKVNNLNNGVTVVGKYVNNNTNMEFMCEKGHVWSAVPSSILSGTGCPYCSGLRVIIGETSLWDTRPDVAILLEDSENGYKYSSGSGKKVNFICPDCKSIQLKRIADVCADGLICSRCSDGISYAEKFMGNILEQLKIDFKKQITKAITGFEWIKYGYRYDFYIEVFDKKFFIETDGGLGHGNKTFHGEDDVDGVRRDLIKDQMAQEHDIQVIRIDCNYKKGERFEHIKKHIMSSQLSNLFDLSSINWELCDRQAQKKIVVQIASLYNDCYTMEEMIENLNYDKMAIQRWLRQAKKIGLCEYDAKELAKRNTDFKKTNTIVVNRYTQDSQYINSYNSLTEAAIDVGSSVGNICRACNNSNFSVRGYKYYRAYDQNQPDKTKIILTTQN